MKMAYALRKAPGRREHTSLEPLDVHPIDPHVLPRIIILVEDLQRAAGALLGGFDLGLQGFSFPPQIFFERLPHSSRVGLFFFLNS